MALRIGVVVLPQRRWAEQAAQWTALEDMGFDHAWTYDHLAWTTLADQPWFATVPTLTAAALVTSRIRLGTWVASPNFRHPVPFAKDLMSLDDVSGGRFVLGVGSGGTGWDATVLGQASLTPGQRVERLTEFVELLSLLLTQPCTTWKGAWFEAVEARMLPGSTQSPRMPFVVAADAPRAMGVAARLGEGWATTAWSADADTPARWWDGVARLAEGFSQAERAAGRSGLGRYLNLDTSPLFSLSSAGAFADACGRAAELGFTDVVAHWPRPGEPYHGDASVLEQVAADLPALRG
jgi:alkanesulfonate monooxygenase SsuD/methylene tetrahydromethanopterin reductase-like flavin-dependent oxidoreductase (luciferase family)